MKGIKRWLSVAMAALLTASGPGVYAEKPETELPLKDRFSTGLLEDLYQQQAYDYYELYARENGDRTPGRDTHILAPSLALVEKERIETEAEGRPAVLSNEAAGTLSWSFTIETAGLYTLSLDYYFDGTGKSDALRRLLVDGEQPFREAASLQFRHLWKDNDDIKVNTLGDEVRPSYEEVHRWQTLIFQDSQGLYDAPYALYFEAGEHTVQLEYLSADMLAGEFRVEPAGRAVTYEEYIAAYTAPAFAADETFQAEGTVLHKNDTTLTLESDGNPSTVPAGITSRRLNVMGGWRWRTGGQSISWVIDVPEDGWYQLGARYLQSWNDGLPSYRRIEIDGEVPFREMEAYRFDYAADWQLETFSNPQTGEPYYFYLRKGERTLTMTVRLSELTPLLNSLNDDAQALSQIIMDITKLTGNDPDPNYDYSFFERIPDLKRRLEALTESLQWKYDLVKSIQPRLPAMANNFLSIQKQLKVMIDKPFKIARNLSDLTDAQSNMGTYYQNLQDNPLLVDYFRLSAAGTSWAGHREAGFFRKLWATLQNFAASFFKDYDNVGGLLDESVEIKETISVWISRGTEWAEIIKQMTDEQFTPRTGIAVNINVVPASQLAAGGINALMLSITSGRAPDVAQGVNSSSPAEFAFRDAVQDLAAYADFDETVSRFLPGIMIPYQYNGGTFALPETMNYSVLFYRKDVLDTLQMELPDTWEELYKYTLPTLYQNGYEFYYPTGNFNPFLFQRGGDYYTGDGLKSALDTPVAHAAFKEYCELFTHYAIPVSANFFNRFRTGTMPLGFGDHSLYILLSTAAPELTGNWGIAPIPGTRRQDGAIDRSNGGLSGECDIIMNQSEHKDASWEYLKWWTSAEVQGDFARELEALIGIEARWNTANVEAFMDLPWNKADLEVIESQWEWVREAPIVLGSYYTGRYLNNAWNSAVIGNMNPKDALDQAVEEINKEMRMKQEEYHVQKN